MSSIGLFVKAVAGLNLKVDQPTQFIFGKADEIANHVGDEILACAGALKSWCEAQIERHRTYVVEHLQDMPEVRDWSLGNPAAEA